MIVMRASILLIFILFGYAALRIWHRKNGPNAEDKNRGFRPGIGFTRLDGMASVSLLLANESNRHVWAEEIEIFLSGLSAEEQTAEPSFRGIQKIRQTVQSGDMVPISLCQAIYKAAGNPQRKYTFAMSSVLRYRIGEDWFEKNLQNYRLRMIGLTVSSIHRERKPLPPIQTQKESRDTPIMESKRK